MIIIAKTPNEMKQIIVDHLKTLASHKHSLSTNNRLKSDAKANLAISNYLTQIADQINNATVIDSAPD